MVKEKKLSTRNGYVWDLVLKALKSIYDQKKTVKVHLSSGKFPNSMEISFDLT